jgi:hypothetical protein
MQARLATAGENLLHPGMRRSTRESIIFFAVNLLGAQIRKSAVKQLWLSGGIMGLRATQGAENG